MATNGSIINYEHGHHLVTHVMSMVNGTVATVLRLDSPPASFLVDWKLWVGIPLFALGMLMENILFYYGCGGCFGFMREGRKTREAAKSVESQTHCCQLRRNCRSIFSFLGLMGYNLLVLAIVPLQGSIFFSIMLWVIVGCALLPELIIFVYLVLNRAVPSEDVITGRTRDGSDTDTYDQYDRDGHFHETHTFLPNSVFEDLTRPFIKTWAVFIGQFILVCLYMDGFEYGIEEMASNSFSSVNYGYWFVGVFCVQYATMFLSESNSQVGPAFDSIRWAQIMRAERIILVKENKEKDVSSVTPHANCIIRLFMEWFINGITRGLIIATVPLFMMSATSSIDLVKDALAIAFITGLDNLNTSVQYKLVFPAQDESYGYGFEEMSTYEGLWPGQGAPPIQGGFGMSRQGRQGGPWDGGAL